MLFKIKYKKPIDHFGKFLIEEKKHNKICNRLSKWHTVFAWWPIRIDKNNVVWLERIARRATEVPTIHYLAHGDALIGRSYLTGNLKFEYKRLVKYDYWNENIK